MTRIGNLPEREEHIIRIKHLVYCSNEPTVQMRAIDSLAVYGKQAISAITDVINLSNALLHNSETSLTCNAFNTYHEWARYELLSFDRRFQS